MNKSVMLVAFVLFAPTLRAAEPVKTTIAGSQSFGKYQQPIIQPPVTGAIDPDAKALFDAEVSRRFADRVAKLEANEKDGWSWIGALPAEKQKIIEEQRRTMLTFKAYEIEEMWRSAAGAAERHRLRNERQAAQQTAAKAEADKREAEIQKKEMTKSEMDSIVAEALLRAATQVDKSKFLKEFGITADEIEQAVSSKQTSLDRDKTKSALWQRAYPSPCDPRIRVLFLPFPSGLAYTVRDVAQRDGKIKLTLNADEEKPAGKDGETSSSETMPKGTCRAISQGLSKALPPNISNYVSLLVPDDADDVALLKKGDVVKSGEWLIPVVIQDNGRIHISRYYFRTKKEMDRVSGTEL